jgi:hypothetical protein
LGPVDHLPASISTIFTSLDAVLNFDELGRYIHDSFDTIHVQGSFYRYVMVVPLGGNIILWALWLVGSWRLSPPKPMAMIAHSLTDLSRKIDNFSLSEP